VCILLGIHAYCHVFWQAHEVAYNGLRLYTSGGIEQRRRLAKVFIELLAEFSRLVPLRDVICICNPTEVCALFQLSIPNFYNLASTGVAATGGGATGAGATGAGATGAGATGAGATGAAATGAAATGAATDGGSGAKKEEYVEIKKMWMDIRASRYLQSRNILLDLKRRAISMVYYTFFAPLLIRIIPNFILFDY